MHRRLVRDGNNTQINAKTDRKTEGPDRLLPQDEKLGVHSRRA